MPDLLLVVMLVNFLYMSQSYKIPRTECDMDQDSVTMRCTCGSKSDPYATVLNKGPNKDLGLIYYGTRYGHNLAWIIKQKMVDLNMTSVDTVIYENCTKPVSIKMDLGYFPKNEKDWPNTDVYQVELTEVKEIVFSNMHSVSLYLRGSMSWGNLTLRFENIQNVTDFYGKKGSVVVYGEISYCEDPCSLVPANQTEEVRCNDCDTNSTLSLYFNSVDTVTLYRADLASYSDENEYGHGKIASTNVNKLQVIGGYYDRVDTSSVTALSCFNSPELHATNCSSFLFQQELIDPPDMVPIFIGVATIAIAFLAVVGALAGSKKTVN